MTHSITTEALVIGAGPAGLMAAEVLSDAGIEVFVAEAMPTPARKFLMAGKSGLNLTMDEPTDRFRAAYDSIPGLQSALHAFGPREVMEWARGLGQPLFTGSSGRVFPKAMKASPLLRAWLARLDGAGCRLQTRCRWTGWSPDAAFFDTVDGPLHITSRITVLACGGASWPRLGSDGAWAEWIGDTAPFLPANMGLTVGWSDHMTGHFGSPVKGCGLRAGEIYSRGEFVISHKGLEGGGIYAVSRAVRDGAVLTIDLRPDLSTDQVRHRLTKQPQKTSLANKLRKALNLDPARIALFQEFGRQVPGDVATRVKHLPVSHDGPRPLTEAISSAGGLRFAALSENFELLDRPGTFAVGEMLDWEAPTGGYLLTACLATGRHGALAALTRMASTSADG